MKRDRFLVLTDKYKPEVCAGQILIVERNTISKDKLEIKIGRNNWQSIITCDEYYKLFYTENFKKL